MSDSAIQKVLDEIDSYEQSVNSSLALIHLYMWDKQNQTCASEVKYWLGKEFQPGGVTPDVLIQLDSSRGLITELKRSLPKNDKAGVDLWKQEFDQIATYDKILNGWSTTNGKVTSQELILLVDQKFAVKVVDYIKQNDLKFDNASKNFCVLKYSPASGRKDAVFLQIHDGKLDDYKHVKNEELRQGVPIALEYLFSSGLAKVKFLDFPPPSVYIMSILWDHVFSSKLTEDDWRTAKTQSGKKIIELEVNPSELRQTLTENFADANSLKGINESAVSEALENFVKIKLAERKKKGNKYIIKYRKKIKDEIAGANKNAIFAELLYGKGIQQKLSDSGHKDSA